MWLEASKGNKTDKTKRSASALISGAACLVALYLVLSPANVAAAMLPYGFLLSLVPLLLVPVQYFSMLRACGSDSSSWKRPQRIVYVGCFVVAFLISICASQIAGRLWLGSVVIPRQTLTPSQINALQDLQVDKDAFSFEVKFSWERDKVRAIFRSGDERERELRAKLRQCVGEVIDGAHD
jgi:hypothetical protein